MPTTTGVGEQLERALDQQLLHERVADLDARPLGRAAVVEGLRRQHRHAADAVAAGLRAVQDDLVADAGRVRQVQVLVPHHADAERVDQRVAGVRRVEDDLAADVRQAEAVAVAADAGDDRRAGRAAVSGASSGPNRSGSITATGRAPIARMSRTMPPTPVAAPWYGST